jgi:hypothetical protein
MNAQSLATAEITVKYINPAKSPGLSARIKDVNGISFGVKPEKLAEFIPGARYVIDYVETIKNGVTYRDIKSAAPAAVAPMAQEQYYQPQRQAAPHYDHPNAPSADRAPRAAAPQPQPAPAAAGKPTDYYRPTAPQDSRRMFVCATLGHFIETGRVDPSREHLGQVIGEIAAAYDDALTRGIL